MSSEQARVENSALAPPASPLHVRRLGIARAAWVLLFALSLGAYAVALPAIYETARTVCVGPECAQWRLSPEGASALWDAGLPVDLYAALTLGLRVLSASAFFAVAALIFRRRSDERLPLWLSFFLLLQAPGSDVGALRLALPPLALLGTLQEYLAMALLVPLFYLFPDGRWVPRWSRVPALLWVVFQFFYYFLPDSPLSGDSWPVLLQGTLFLGWFGSALFAQVYRYRHVAGPMEQQQTKWVVAGLTTAILGSVMLASVEATPVPVLAREVAGTLVDPVFLVLPLSIGIAILRYRLWDIDIIINRSLVYGALTVATVGLYALVVGGLGALLQARGSPLLALLGAGTIAVLFAPLRDRLQRGVNRLMYGERGDPYGVLSRLGRQLEGALAPDAVLHTVAHTVKDALKLPYVAIALRDGDAFTINAAAGEPVANPLSLPLVHRGETVGQLLLGPRAGERSLSAPDRRLLDDIARQAGVAAQAVRLTADLRSSNEELRTA
ncbi:MAG TPA: GAF domain-containing protein, partial [Herpetosiphonaceae bacterium]|nr:GAF domain-containing protein [Herpetosiphonaceae bacterium]